eukprot:CAMPEP_0185164216 /NCGR_PEP_ID=MMETSP1139-20130426/9060_1 /TAXON_ID=298111 /ORGANISM="Pavlova sp., Strain CCMP459" /LENGTH=195 /DNA_ID=CAMNT_0027729587 /DNA_START=226 /DNA_END=811 /DNA_ORIENTATION=-
MLKRMNVARQQWELLFFGRTAADQIVGVEVARVWATGLAWLESVTRPWFRVSKLLTAAGEPKDAIEGGQKLLGCVVCGEKTRAPLLVQELGGAHDELMQLLGESQRTQNACERLNLLFAVREKVPDPLAVRYVTVACEARPDLGSQVGSYMLRCATAHELERNSVLLAHRRAQNEALELSLHSGTFANSRHDEKP